MLHVKAFSLLFPLKSQGRAGSQCDRYFELGPKNFASTPQPTSLPCFPADLNLQPHIHVARYNGAPPHTQRPILKICQAILLSRHFFCKINLLLTCFRADTTCFHLLQVAQKYDIFSNCSSSVGREFLSNKATRSPTLKVLSHTKYT